MYVQGSLGRNIGSQNGINIPLGWAWVGGLTRLFLALGAAIASMMGLAYMIGDTAYELFLLTLGVAGLLTAFGLWMKFK